MRLMRYNPKAKHVPWKDMVIADTLSRSPINTNESNTEQAVAHYLESITNTWSVSPSRLKRIKEATKRECQTLMKDILEGWPKHFSDLPDSIKPLYSLGSHFSTDDGIITVHDKIYISTVMIREVLQRIHEGHQGVKKCREWAKSCVWWNGLSKDIANFFEKCSHCQLYERTQKKEPIITTPLPDRPWQRIATDLCEFQNNHYLIISDYFSRYIEITNLKKDTTSMREVEAIKTVCAKLR
ncbi:uncharacterized protein [Antedon mediterranea]|uniref:uncharacterized protein n=1 Tax=Antedon mediterranea TaxID=105859 RepID=UPI003AF42876